MVSDMSLRFRARRGTSLVEALVALLVMAFGMMAVAGIQGRLRYSGDAAKQRAEATRIASAEMERLRGFGALPAPTKDADGKVQNNEVNVSTLAATSTEYTLARTVNWLADGGAEVTLNVSWRDRTKGDTDGAMNLVLKSAVAAVDPKLAVAAFVPPDFGIALRRSQDRHVAIPGGAKKLDENRSVFKPSPSGTVALVFNNHTGMVLQLCAVAAGIATGQIDDDDLTSCTTLGTGGAYLLSGHVVYDPSASPDPAQPRGDVIAHGLSVALLASVHPDAPAPQCFTDSSANAAAGVKALDYYCLIPPRNPSETDTDKTLFWSGRSNLTGLNLTDGGQRVCRYSDDYNGDGRISNAEHPGDYVRVTESLSKQNFLVVAHTATCPAGQRVDVSRQIYRNTVTANHQPQQ